MKDFFTMSGIFLLAYMVGRTIDEMIGTVLFLPVLMFLAGEIYWEIKE